MIVQISREAADFVSLRGGRLWVWAAYPRVCCTGSPAWMNAATEAPPDLAGFRPVAAPGVQLFFRALGGQQPATLEVGLRGRRRPQVQSYWDGCLMALP